MSGVAVTARASSCGPRAWSRRPLSACPCSARRGWRCGTTTRRQGATVSPRRRRGSRSRRRRSRGRCLDPRRQRSRQERRSARQRSALGPLGQTTPRWNRVLRPHLRPRVPLRLPLSRSVHLPPSLPRSVHRAAPHLPLPCCPGRVPRAVRKERLLQAQGPQPDRLAPLLMPRPGHAAVLPRLSPNVREPWRICRHEDQPLDSRSCRAQVRLRRQQLDLPLPAHPPRHLCSPLHRRPRPHPCPLPRRYLRLRHRLQPSPLCPRSSQTTCLPHCRKTTPRGRAN